MVKKIESKIAYKDQQGMAKLMKRKVFLLLIIFSLFFGSLDKAEAVIDRIVAIVNQEIITLSEVEKYAETAEKELRSEDPIQRKEEKKQLYRKIIDKLIEERLIEQEAKKLGIKVTSKEIEAALEEIKQRNNLTQEEFERALAKEGLSIDALKKQIEKRLQNTKLINFSLKMDVKMDEKKLREFYEKNIDRYQRTEQYRPAHIFFAIPKDATPAEIQEIKKKCQAVLEKIRRGEDFGEMALLYSEDTSSKDKGDLGFFRKGELLAVLEKEASRLKVGEVSGIVRSEFGFHIIKLLDRKGGGVIPFEEVVEKVKKDFMENEMEKAFKQFLTNLKEKSVIEIKL
jgi:peptidyl-prolyl cis-trans isomerase SurA